MLKGVHMYPPPPFSLLSESCVRSVHQDNVSYENKH